MKIGASIVVHGRVQGVAFRHYTCVRARELGITGWVRNLPNGSVAGLFEGEEGAVRSMVDWCHDGPPAAQVERVDVRQVEYGGEFDGFEIAY
ncbi:MAG: acylphosphatase [Desulfuromonadales bacterium]|nr:acylphosphatase [Desulfuromonadales bacterium]